MVDQVGFRFAEITLNLMQQAQQLAMTTKVILMLTIKLIVLGKYMMVTEWITGLWKSFQLTVIMLQF